MAFHSHWCFRSWGLLGKTLPQTGHLAHPLFLCCTRELRFENSFFAVVTDQWLWCSYAWTNQAESPVVGESSRKSGGGSGPKSFSAAFTMSIWAMDLDVRLKCCPSTKTFATNVTGNGTFTILCGPLLLDSLPWKFQMIIFFIILILVVVGLKWQLNFVVICIHYFLLHWVPHTPLPNLYRHVGDCFLDHGLHYCRFKGAVFFARLELLYKPKQARWD